MTNPRSEAEKAEASGRETLRALRRVPVGLSGALVIRHSEREEGASEWEADPPDTTWPLTPHGRVLARQFGRELPPFANLLLSWTRIPRTRATAEEIAAGFRAAHPDAQVRLEGADPVLSLTGFYARDPHRRDEWRKKLGARFYHAWVSGQIPPDVLVPPEEAVHDLVGRFRSHLERSPPSTLLVAVTHDVHVFAVREVLLGRPVPERPWVGYLDGVVLSWDSQGRWTASWRHESTRGDTA